MNEYLLAGIYIPFPGPYDIVTGGLKVSNGGAPNACIQEDFQVPVSIRSGSILS